MAKKVLIVEDTTDIREALAKLLEYEGYEVVVASSGLEGYLLAEVHNPDLILMDLAMPGMNGIEATRRIRADPSTCQIPIICITSYGETYRAEALTAGCNEVHSKTSFMDAFQATLQKYLGN